MAGFTLWVTYRSVNTYTAHKTTTVALSLSTVLPHASHYENASNSTSPYLTIEVIVSETICLWRTTVKMFRTG